MEILLIITEVLLILLIIISLVLGYKKYTKHKTPDDDIDIPPDDLTIYEGVIQTLLTEPDEIQYDFNTGQYNCHKYHFTIFTNAGKYTGMVPSITLTDQQIAKLNTARMVYDVTLRKIAELEQEQYNTSIKKECLEAIKQQRQLGS